MSTNVLLNMAIYFHQPLLNIMPIYIPCIFLVYYFNFGASCTHVTTVVLIELQLWEGGSMVNI